MSDNMTAKQAISYIDSLMQNYHSHVILAEKEDPSYRLCHIWLSKYDMRALEMAKLALQAQDEHESAREDK